MKVKVLVVGDIHGRHELIVLALKTFIEGDYDYIIFLGDYADSWDRSDNDILRSFSLILQAKRADPNKVILLIGNHDEPYFNLDPKEYIVQGHRHELHRALSHVLVPRRNDFNYAFGLGNFLFTHAGVSMPWFLKHFDTLAKWSDVMEANIADPKDLWIILDNISRTSDKSILFEVGPDRGGIDTNHGGPLWCDRDELITGGPMTGINQVVGHTSQHSINRVHTFEDNKRYEDTSVTFIDVLSYRHQFLTLEIKT